MPPVEMEFQCVICCEDFDHDEKPPVVLPCGHTFVCAQCAKRLKRCMECRTSLFISLPSSGNGPNPQSLPTVQRRHVSPVRYRTISASSSYGSPGRYGHNGHSGSASPVPKKAPVEQQTPLPLPKNLVILSLMEHNAMASDGKDGEEGNNESEALTVHPTCGTYEVRDRNGLQLVSESAEQTRSPMEKESSRRSFWKIRKKKKAAESVRPKEGQSPSGISQSRHEKCKPNCTASILVCSSDTRDDEMTHRSLLSSQNILNIKFGERVQIVHFFDGVAKLARGKGYIFADPTQLVRVGDSHDNVCRIEGIISQIADERQKLQQRVLELDEKEAGLIKEISHYNATGDEHPVIEPADVNDAATSDRDLHVSQSSATTSGDESSQDILLNPSPQSLPSHARQPFDVSWEVNGSFLSPNSSSLREFPKLPELGTELAHIEKRSSSDSSHGNCFEEFVCVDRTTTSDYYNNVGESAQHPKAHRAAAVTDSPSSVHLYLTPRPSTDSVDFRTGMSGHMGLSSVRTNPERIQHQRSEIRMMSEHRGLSHIRPIRVQSSMSSRSVASKPTM